MSRVRSKRVESEGSRLDAVYITYWSLRDPLTESQSLPVLRALAQWGYRIGLITFEQSAYLLNKEAEVIAASRLENEGISWFPLRYHRWPPLVSTAFDILSGFFLLLKLRRKLDVRLFHSRGTVSAVSACFAAMLTDRRFFYDADGPLSQEYADIGIWSHGSCVHRLARWSENRLFACADRAAVLTEYRRQEVQALHPNPVSVVPCAVDDDHFEFRPAARARIRKELKLSGTVFVYAGKWGGWYAVEEMFDFFVVARERLGDANLLVLTNELPEKFRAAARARGVDSELAIHRSSHQEMPDFLSAADVGLSFVRPLPSKTACSPIKNGEYLACGLPVITPAGIGDYSELVERERVGLVLTELAEFEYTSAVRSLQQLLSDPGLRQRCRKTARKEVGLAEVALPKYRGIYDALLPLPMRGGFS